MNDRDILEGIKADYRVWRTMYDQGGVASADVLRTLKNCIYLAERLVNDAVLLRATAEGAQSLMCDVQDDCIAEKKAHAKTAKQFVDMQAYAGCLEKKIDRAVKELRYEAEELPGQERGEASEGAEGQGPVGAGSGDGGEDKKD